MPIQPFCANKRAMAHNEMDVNAMYHVNQVTLVLRKLWIDITKQVIEIRAKLNVPKKIMSVRELTLASS